MIRCQTTSVPCVLCATPWGNLYAIRGNRPKAKAPIPLGHVVAACVSGKSRLSNGPTGAAQAQRLSVSAGKQFRRPDALDFAGDPTILAPTFPKSAWNFPRRMPADRGGWRGRPTSLWRGWTGSRAKGCVTLNGEIYAVGSTARLTTDEDDRPVLKVFICFTETPSVRIMKFIPVWPGADADPL